MVCEQFVFYVSFTEYKKLYCTTPRQTLPLACKDGIKSKNRIVAHNGDLTMITVLVPLLTQSKISLITTINSH